MAFLHTCLQSLCEEARLVMRGYYLEEKPRLSIFLLLLSSVRDPHQSLSSLISLSLSLSLSLCICRLFSYNSPGKHDASPSQEECWGVLEEQWCFSVGSAKVIRPLPTLVQLGLSLEYFRCWLVAKHLYNNKPTVWAFLLFWFVHGYLNVCAYLGRSSGCKYLKSLRRTFNWFWGSLNLLLMSHILPTSANETISEEIADYYPVFYYAFTQSAQSVETLPNDFMTLRQQDRSTAFFKIILIL